jgi:nitroreductase
MTYVNFLDLARKRSSVRRYAPDPVPRDVLAGCLEAARLAPSACNSQPWQFIVVDEPDLKHRLAEKAFSGAYAMNTFAKEAPVLVAVVTGRSTYAARLGGLLRGVQYSLVDIGIACEHFVLAAAEAGVGTCWLGWFNERGVKEVLGLPAKARVDIVLSVGYPAAPDEAGKKRKPMSEFCRYNRDG